MSSVKPRPLTYGVQAAERGVQRGVQGGVRALGAEGGASGVRRAPIGRRLMVGGASGVGGARGAAAEAVGRRVGASVTGDGRLPA